MRKLFYLFIFLLSLSFLSAQSQDLSPKNLSLLGHLSYPIDINDVWAYVDSAGNEYALVGTIAGLSIVDLNDPSNPTEIHFIPGDTSIWRDMHIFKHYAYTSNETGSGTLIVDLSDLPHNITYKDTTLGGSTTAHNVWIEDGYLYLIGYNFSGLLIFNLNNDPWNPEITGGYFNRYVHDLYVRGDTGYSAEVLDGLLTVLDLSDKTSPKVISTHGYPGAFTHAAWLNDAGDVCFTMDELSRAWTIAWDVSDPTDIKELDRIQSSLSYGKAAPHNVHVLNDFLINSVYADGVQIVDAARPGNLVEIGFYDTSPRIGAGLRGCWGTYPYLPSGIILASDMGEGLFVLQPNYQRACYLEGKITDASSNMPLSNVEIEILDSEVIDYSKTTGDYAVGIADSGTYEIIYSKYGYNSEVRTISLSNGNLQIENIALTPADYVSLSIEILEEGTNMPIPEAMIKLSANPGFHLDLMTDQEGIASESGFLTGGYRLIVGKWGYKTVSIPASFTPSDSSATIYLKKGYYDDFTFDFNWIGTQTAQQGNWERVSPIGSFINGYMFNPDHDSRNDFSSKAYITENTSGGQASLNDLKNGKTTLFSPNIDLSEYIDPVISFEYWLMKANNTGGNNANDTLTLKMISGGIEIGIGKYTNATPIWQKVEFRVKDFHTLEATNLLLFEIEDLAPEGILEAGIDHFQVIETGWAVGINEELTAASFNIYPNPVQDQFFVEFDLSKINDGEKPIFEIYTLQGKRLLQKEFETFQGKEMINVDLPSGMYISSIKVGKRIIKSIKWIKN